MVAWLVIGVALAADARAERVLERAAEAHGLTRADRIDLSFDFRGTPFQVHLDGDDVRYERTVQTDEGPRTDRLRGDRFEALRAGEPLVVEPEQADVWRRQLNSVAYFATMPRPLFDDAVIATSLGRTRLGGQRWDTVEVRFREEGGGDDHDDVFRYWFHPRTHELGFLAYTFHTGKGGVRLRRAIGRHEVDGVVLVDWANHGAGGPDPAIDAAVAAYEAGELPELSTIALDDIAVERLPER